MEYPTPHMQTKNKFEDLFELYTSQLWMNGLAMVYKMMKNKEKKIMLLVLTSIGKILRFHTRRGGVLAIEKLQLW